jgi:c-di-GMP-related signal transduction protein
MQLIARQPIFNTDRSVEAYELLFRDGEENRFTGTDLEHASRSTTDTAARVGLDLLSDGCSVFLNCTHDLIVSGYLKVLPPQVTVVEVLESVVPDRELVEACRRLKGCGYRIALDDFVDNVAWAPLIEIADVIKVDFRLSSPATRARVVERYANPQRRLLAEKVETYEEFDVAAKLGYTLFQGFFFCQPNLLSTRRVPAAHPRHLELLKALSKPALDLRELECLIKSDPALCYRLLHYLNSPLFYLRSEIRSILHGLVLLGETELRKWLLLVCAVTASDSSNPELINAALVRARFAELLAPHTGLSAPTLFVLGLLSLMDVILEKPRHVMLQEIAVPSEARAALLGTRNAYACCHELTLAYEAADWPRCDQLRRKLKITAQALRSAYLEAVRWAGQIRSAGDQLSRRQRTEALINGRQAGEARRCSSSLES